MNRTEKLKNRESLFSYTIYSKSDAVTLYIDGNNVTTVFVTSQFLAEIHKTVALLDH